MKRISALIGCIVCLFLISSAIAFAEEKKAVEPAATEVAAEKMGVAEPAALDASLEENIISAPPKTSIGLLLNLLQEKNIISAEDAAAFSKQPASVNQQENINALLNLLQSKGVITVEEAGTLADDPAGAAKKLPGPAGRNTATVPLILPMDDRRFVQLLKDKWIDIGKRIDEFYPTFNDSRDPEYIISRMKATEVITDDEAFELLRQYRTNYLSGAVATTLETKEKTYLDRVTKSVVADLEKNTLAKIRNDWTQRLKWSGDLRLRYEGTFFGDGNADFLKPDNPSQLMNSTEDRTRFLIRARLALDAKISDTLKVGIGLATGNTSNPVSTNATLGDSLNKKSILIDRAYFNWNPDPALSVWAGRFPNPWFYSDLIWDADLNFEGVVFQYRPRLNSSWGLFFNAGAIPIQEVELSSRDKWLFGAQGGFEYQVKDTLTARLATAIYDFEHCVGIVNNPAQPGQTDWTAPQFQQKGNTLMDIDPSPAVKTAYAAKFSVLNITGTLDLAFWQPIHIILLGDYVKNLGYDKSAVDRRTGSDVKEETDGYQLGVTVGYPSVRNFGEWKALFNYKYLESDAVMDAFTDSDFHLGGTNAKGWIIGVDLGVAKDTWLTARWLTADQISGPPLSIDTLQLNINARF